jgi:hypothetical protein
LENPNYQEKFHADQESYLWDAIIEEFADHIFEATLLTEEPCEVTDVEVALRIMDRERRVFRRSLAKGISDKIRSVQDGKIGVRSILSLDQEGVG